jgi:hypothetical protein
METAMADDNTKNSANTKLRKQRQAEDGKRAMTDYENAAVAMRAKTAKLRALRLARDAADEAEREANPPPVKKKKTTKKKEAAEG